MSMKYHIMYVDEQGFHEYDTREFSESNAIHHNAVFDNCAVMPVCNKDGDTVYYDVVKVVKDVNGYRTQVVGKVYQVQITEESIFKQISSWLCEEYRIYDTSDFKFYLDMIKKEAEKRSSGAKE